MMYFVVAYVFLWACMLWYMRKLAKKQQLLHDEIRILKNRLQIRE